MASFDVSATARGFHRPTVSFELMPPRNPAAAPKFWNTARKLVEAHPDFVSVTYGAAGATAIRRAQWWKLSCNTPTCCRSRTSPVWGRLETTWQTPLMISWQPGRARSSRCGETHQRTNLTGRHPPTVWCRRSNSLRFCVMWKRNGVRQMRLRRCVGQ